MPRRRSSPASRPGGCWHADPAVRQSARVRLPETLLRAHVGAPRTMHGSPLLLDRIASGGCWRADRAVRQGARLKLRVARGRAIARLAGR